MVERAKQYRAQTEPRESRVSLVAAAMLALALAIGVNGAIFGDAMLRPIAFASHDQPLDTSAADEKARESRADSVEPCAAESSGRVPSAGAFIGGWLNGLARSGGASVRRELMGKGCGGQATAVR